MRLLFTFACLFTCFILRGEEAAAPAAAATPLLNGTSWAITITSGEGEKSDDVLSFNGGVLTSQTYAEARFAPGPATVTGTAESATVVATLADLKHRELILRGKVAGNKIEGTIAVGVLGQYERSTFSGTKK